MQIGFRVACTLFDRAMQPLVETQGQDGLDTVQQGARDVVLQLHIYRVTNRRSGVMIPRSYTTDYVGFVTEASRGCQLSLLYCFFFPFRGLLMFATFSHLP